jgi:hypothetical protein
MGYAKVAHYPEGKQGWMEAGLPVDRASQRHWAIRSACLCVGSFSQDRPANGQQSVRSVNQFGPGVQTPDGRGRQILSATYVCPAPFYRHKKGTTLSATRMHIIEESVFSPRSRHFQQAQNRNNPEWTALSQHPLLTSAEDGRRCFGLVASELLPLAYMCRGSPGWMHDGAILALL